MDEYDFTEDSGGPDDNLPWPADFTSTLTLLDSGSYDPNQYAFEIDIVVTEATSVLIEEGPFAGNYQATGGVINTLLYYNMDGDVVLTITDAGIPLAWAASLTVENFDDFDRILDYVQGQDNNYTGSNNGNSSTWDDYEDYDYIQTGSGDDLVRAGGGHDYIEDGGGSDDYRGGNGNDMLTYDNWYYNPEGMVSGITVGLNAETIMGPDGELDQVRNIDRIYGTWMDDSFKGNGNDNTFRGYQGDDFFNGRGGWDEVDYSRDYRYGGVDGVRVFLNNGEGTDGFGSTDTYNKIEGVRGTQYRDKIRDNDLDNALKGEDGNDRLIVGLGNDYLSGGEGADEFKFLSDDFGANYIDDFNPDEGDFIVTKHAGSFSDLTFVQSDGDVVLSYGTGEIRIADFDLANIDSADFIT